MEDRLGAEGVTEYRLACRPPPLDLDTVLDPFNTGQSVTGNLCFRIAASDVGTLLLFGTTTTPEDPYKTVYFVLR